MIRVYVETVTDCEVCGEVACERDLLFVETAAEAEALDVRIGGIVCRECSTDPDVRWRRELPELPEHLHDDGGPHGAARERQER